MFGLGKLRKLFARSVLPYNSQELQNFYDDYVAFDRENKLLISSLNKKAEILLPLSFDKFCVALARMEKNQRGEFLRRMSMGVTAALQLNNPFADLIVDGLKEKGFIPR